MHSHVDSENLKILLGEEQWKLLFSVSDLRGALIVARVWGEIFISILVVAFWPNVLTFFLALIVIGSRQLALGLIVHEAMHGMLFSSKKVNDFVGKWICATPVWLNFSEYRAEHFDHHKYLGTEKDPDIGIKKPFPVSLQKWFSLLVLTLIGTFSYRRIKRRILMSFGRLTYSVTTNSKKVKTENLPSFRTSMKRGTQDIVPHLVSLAILTLLMGTFGFPQGILIYILAFYTTFGVFFAILQVSQHTLTPAKAPLIANVRTFILHPLVQWLFFPLCSNYHIEHHALMRVPYYRLPLLNRELTRVGLIGNDQLHKGLLKTMNSFCK